MAREIIDGFDSYATADIGLRWPQNDAAIATTSPRTGAKHLALGGQQYIQRPLSGNLATVIMGGAFKIDIIASTRILMVLLDNGNSQLDVRMDASGHLIVSRAGTTLGTSTATITTGSYFHLALSATIHNSTGAYELRLNNVNILSGTGANTRATANNYATDARFGYFAGGAGGSVNLYWDDVFVFSTSGSTCNAFPGDVKVGLLTVNGNGSTQNFTPSTGSDNSANVDDATPNADTDYNSSATVGHIDLYNLTNASSLGTVFTVQTCLIARKDDAGTIHMGAVCKSGATTSVGAVDTSLGNNYAALLDGFDVDPNTSAAWTQANLNAAEFGAKVIS